MIENCRRFRISRHFDQRYSRQSKQIPRRQQRHELVGDLFGSIEIGRIERLLARLVAHIDESKEAAASENRRGEQAVRALPEEDLGKTHVGAEAVDEECVALDGERVDEIIGPAHKPAVRIMERVAGDELEAFFVQIVRCREIERRFGCSDVLDAAVENLLELRLELL